jgi:hypothetical protein
MNKNDMRAVVYLIISLIALYFLLDAFLGKKKINDMVDQFIGDFGGPAASDTGSGGAAPQPTMAPAAAPAAAPAKTQKDPGKVKIPQPQQDPGKVKIPQPEGTPKTKSGSANGLNLHDIFGQFNPFPIGPPIAASGAAILAGAAALTQLPRMVGGALEGAF